MLATAAQFKKLLLDIHLCRSLAPWDCFRRNVTRKKNPKARQDRKNLPGSLRNCGQKEPLCTRLGTRGAPGHPGYTSGKMSASWSQYTEGDSQGTRGFSNNNPDKNGIETIVDPVTSSLSSEAHQQSHPSSGQNRLRRSNPLTSFSSVARQSPNVKIL